jgi:hypothetical protein
MELPDVVLEKKEATAAENMLIGDAIHLSSLDGI